MTRSRRRGKTQSNEAGGFRFAVTLLAALGTIIYYTVYSYLQTTPVDPLWYFFIRGLIPVAFILVGGLLLYILIEGYSIEIDTRERDNYSIKSELNISERKEDLELRARTAYLIIFPSCLALLTWVFCSFVLISFKLAYGLEWPHFNYLLSLTSTAIALIVVYLVFGNVVKDWIPIDKFKTKRKKVYCSFMIILYVLGILIIIWSVAFQFVPESRLLQGHVTVDMESIYYKNDVPIPVLIHVTGPNNGLVIALAEKDANDTLNEKAAITLSPGFPFNETDCLLGNTSDYGTYTVFINTTDLTEGYYELWCVRPYYQKTFSSRSFYLLNSSLQSVTENLNTS